MQWIMKDTVEHTVSSLELLYAYGFSSRSNDEKPYQKYWQNKIENRHGVVWIRRFQIKKSQARRLIPSSESRQHKPIILFVTRIFYGLEYCITNFNLFSANSIPLHSSTAMWCIFSRGIQLYFTSNPRNPRTWMFVHISVPEITCIVQNLKSMYTSGYLVCSFSAMPCQIASRVLSLDVSQKIGEPMKIRSC